MNIGLFGEIAGMIRERIPERIFYSKGTGAFGYFVPNESLSKFTEASFLSDPNKTIPVLVRFSQMLGSKGSPDTMRTPRGIAVKLYTDDGIQDIITCSCPVKFVRDEEKIPDLIRSLNADTATNTSDPTGIWRFAINNPEIIDALIWLFSDYGTVKSYVNIETYGVNKYVWNTKGRDKYFVRFRIAPQSGIKYITSNEAEFLAGYDPDIAIREIRDLLSENKTIVYHLYAHLEAVSSEAESENDRASLVINVGDIIVDRCVSDYISQCECATFSPRNNVSGISLLKDNMSEIMTVAHEDSQRYRLGKNYDSFEINKPGFAANFESKGEKNRLLFNMKESYTNLSFEKYDRMGANYDLFTESEKERLSENIADNIKYFDILLLHRIIELINKFDMGLYEKIINNLNL